MLEDESGVPGEDKSTCSGASFSTLISDGVCKGGALKVKKIYVRIYVRKMQRKFFLIFFLYIYIRNED